jgi:hypothetical protein
MKRLRAAVVPAPQRGLAWRTNIYLPGRMGAGLCRDETMRVRATPQKAKMRRLLAEPTGPPNVAGARNRARHPPARAPFTRGRLAAD